LFDLFFFQSLFDQLLQIFIGQKLDRQFDRTFSGTGLEPVPTSGPSLGLFALPANVLEDQLQRDRQLRVTGDVS
jgi:hypothetical protein